MIEKDVLEIRTMTIMNVEVKMGINSVRCKMIILFLSLLAGLTLNVIALFVETNIVFRLAVVVVSAIALASAHKVYRKK